MNKSPYCRHLWYIRNILQWNKNNIKSMRMTNGDYYSHVQTAKMRSNQRHPGLLPAFLSQFRQKNRSLKILCTCPKIFRSFLHQKRHFEDPKTFGENCLLNTLLYSADSAHTIGEAAV